MHGLSANKQTSFGTIVLSTLQISIFSFYFSNRTKEKKNCDSYVRAVHQKKKEKKIASAFLRQTQFLPRHLVGLVDASNHDGVAKDGEGGKDMNAKGERSGKKSEKNEVHVRVMDTRAELKCATDADVVNAMYAEDVVGAMDGENTMDGHAPQGSAW